MASNGFMRKKDSRSKSALEADELQEQVVTRGRVVQVWLLIGLLAVGVGVAAWFQVREIFIFAGMVAWAVFVLHLNFTQVLHELFEINDQIAGRKDEFRSLIQREGDSRGHVPKPDDQF